MPTCVRCDKKPATGTVIWDTAERSCIRVVCDDCKELEREDFLADQPGDCPTFVFKPLKEASA